MKSFAFFLLWGSLTLVPGLFGQSPNQWLGWVQCTVTVEGPAVNGNGVIVGQYFHQDTQTWQLTGGAVNGLINPGTYSLLGSGWDTTKSGRTWTVSHSVGADFSIRQRGGDYAWMIQLSGHDPISGPFATILPSEPSPKVSEFRWPDIVAPAQSVKIYGSSTVFDPGGKFGVLQPGGPVSQIACSWKFLKGSAPPPPPTPVLVPPSVPHPKPVNAPAGSHFIPITPCRAYDTRIGVHTRGGTLPGVEITPVSPRTFALANACGIPPSGATAVSLNITAVPLEPLSGMMVRTVGQAQPARLVLSAADGLPTANAAIVPFGSGTLEISTTNRSHAIIDVNGFFVPEAQQMGSAFYPFKPCRAIATSGGALAAGVTRDVAIRSQCNLPGNATAYVMNVKAFPQGFLGSLTAWDTGQARPNTSNLNAYDAQPKSILAIVKAGTNGNVSFFPSDAMDLVVDVVGFFAPPGADGATTFHEMGACKVTNTQDPMGPMGGPVLLGQTPRDFPIGIPAGACGATAWARAYLLNFTVAPLIQLANITIQPSGPGNVVGWTLFATDAQVTAGAALLPASLSGLRVLASDATHLTIDIAGYFD